VEELPPPDDPVLEVLPEEDPLLPEDPVLEVPLPEDPLPVPLPEEPLLEVPLPVLEVPLPDGALLAGMEGMAPPPQPARKQMANNRPDILSMQYPFCGKDRACKCPGQMGCADDFSAIET
jgi:hypothetical protein